MPTYREFSTAFFVNQLPRVTAVDRTLRALPTGMRDAIARHLGVPQGPSQVASMIFGQILAYVDLYRQTFQHDGTLKYMPYNTDDGCITRMGPQLLHWGVARGQAGEHGGSKRIHRVPRRGL